MGGERNTGAGQRIARLAEGQHGVASVQQLRECGLSDEMIATRVAIGAMHPIFRGAYAVGHREIGRRGRMLAAVLACGGGAVLSHGSAAELLGLWEKRAALIDITDRNQAGRKIQGVRWHRVRGPARDEITVIEGIPCTIVSRTLVDLAGSFGEHALRRFVEQAAVLRLLDVEEIDRILARGRRRGAVCLRAILESWRTEGRSVPRLRSLLEARLLAALADAGLPRPQCNRVLWIEGRRIEVDLLWEDQRLAIETDGEQTHDIRRAFHGDRKRDQLLVAAGYRVARVTWRQVEREQDAVVGRISRMLVT